MSIDLEAKEAIKARAEEAIAWVNVQHRTDVSSNSLIQLGRDIESLLAEMKRQAAEIATVTAERDAARDCIDVAEEIFTRIADAAEYVKPNTGIWHTVHIALDEIKQWRGAGKEQNDGTQFN